MTANNVTAYALRFPESTEEMPFGDLAVVYKAAGRIFCILSPAATKSRLSLKCDPDLADVLRHQYPAITPGYHLNKRHWNTIELDGSIPDIEIREMIYHSYERVIAKLPKATRQALQKEIDGRNDLRR